MTNAIRCTLTTAEQEESFTHPFATAAGIKERAECLAGPYASAAVVESYRKELAAELAFEIGNNLPALGA